MKSAAYFIIVLLPELIQAITVTPNGNSPGMKMAGGIRVELQKGGFIPISANSIARGGDSMPPEFINGSKLSAKERFRRLIPYINFYQNGDTDYNDSSNQLPPQLRSKEATMRYNNAPQYFGNYKKRPNITPERTSNYAKVETPQFYQEQVKPLPGYDLYDDLQSIRVPSKNQYNSHLYDFLNPIPVPVQGIARAPSQESVNLFNANAPTNVQYYEDELVPLKNYKLVPYEQTPPVSMQPNENIHYFSPREFDFSDKPQEVSIYSQPNNHLVSNHINSKTTVSSTYDDGSSNTQTESYEQLLYNTPESNPRTETGFIPIIPTTDPTTLSSTAIANDQNIVRSKPNHKAITPSSSGVYEDSIPIYNTEHLIDTQFNDVNELATLLKVLQRSHSLPQKITAENIGPSLKTLVKILKGVNNVVASDAPEPAVSTPRPFQLNVQQPTPSVAYRGPSTVKTIEIETVNALPDYPSQDLEEEHYPQIENEPSSVDVFPAHTPEGGTPGRPGIDYPILSAIPRTSFDCKTQRYKGFFGDPETDCQVWHYCDLNGGQASFLCPNGTIFSQVGLTCDWWFNVKCSTTTQLYVLNERLYKYILPYTPKFPEDYSGPLVDKYLTLKYKEMEENFKKNRKHNEAMDKIEDAIKSASKEQPKIDLTKVEPIESDKPLEPEEPAKHEETTDALHAENRIGADTELPFIAKVETKENAVEINNPGTSGALSPYEQ